MTTPSAATAPAARATRNAMQMLVLYSAGRHYSAPRRAGSRPTGATTLYVWPNVWRTTTGLVDTCGATRCADSKTHHLDEEESTRETPLTVCEVEEDEHVCRD